MKAAAFAQLTKGIRQAGRIRRGEARPARSTAFDPADVKAIRAKLGRSSGEARAKLGRSQPEFALMIGVSVATPRNWEQGRRTPDGPALALLRVAAANPNAVARAPGAGPPRGAP